uniref:Uncharacterized protein n=1 Tax=uncultured marine thaumarchaeote KM3_98_C03 TaxID=1456352 RepID=A0A075HXR2_9ARCH|nr:hypothetical protein [uncultured marine thaumarchaeote KM3_98_C03]
MYLQIITKLNFLYERLHVIIPLCNTVEMFCIIENNSRVISL